MHWLCLMSFKVKIKGLVSTSRDWEPFQPLKGIIYNHDTVSEKLYCPECGRKWGKVSVKHERVSRNWAGTPWSELIKYFKPEILEVWAKTIFCGWFSVIQWLNWWAIERKPTERYLKWLWGFRLGQAVNGDPITQNSCHWRSDLYKAGKFLLLSFVVILSWYYRLWMSWCLINVCPVLLV